MPVTRYHSSRSQALLGNGLALEAPASTHRFAIFMVLGAPALAGSHGDSENFANSKKSGILSGSRVSCLDQAARELLFPCLLCQSTSGANFF